MTVATATSRASYSGNGVTTAFTVPFRFLEDSHLAVYLIAADGTSTLQTITTHYTVSGAGDAQGTVTFVTAPASGEGVVILRDVPFTQAKDYVTGDKFPAESHEQALDKLTMMVQQQQEELDRSMKTPVSDDGSELEALSEALLAVNAIAAEVEAVAAIDDNVTTVAGISADVTTVAGISADVTTVAGISANVTAVANNETNIDAVAADEADIGVVATNIADVNTVAGNVAAILAKGGVSSAADRTALKASDPTVFTEVYMTEAGREGVFLWDASDLSTQVAADTGEDRYVAPSSDATGASGAWVRAGSVATGSYFETDTPRAYVHRFADRMMIGDAAAYNGEAAPGATGSWLFDQGAGSSTLEWLEINARLASVTSRGIGLTGAARNDNALLALGTIGIGVNNGTDASGRSWGFYGEGILNNVNGRAKGMELNAVNLVDVHTAFTPYSAAATTLALWLVSGGDATVNPTTYEADAAIGIGNNGNTFDAGIVFTDGSLTRDDGATGRAHAVRLAFDHALEWYEYTTETLALSIASQITEAAYKQELRFSDAGLDLLNTGGKSLFKVDWVVDAVNYANLVPSATGSSVDLFARGDDTNITLRIGGKGTGFVTFISNINMNNVNLARNGVQVVGARKTGWATATGTATRTTFDTATVTTAQLAERLKALIDDIHGTAGHGLIGT